MLAATLSNLCFLTRLVATRGLEDSISTFTSALDAIADSHEEGDVAAVACQIIALHRSLLQRVAVCCSVLQCVAV